MSWDWIALLDGGARYFVVAHIGVLVFAVLKGIDLWASRNARRWLKGPMYPEDLAHDAISQEVSMVELSRGVWVFGLGAGLFPFVGLAATVFEVGQALGTLGAGLRPEALSVPLGQALRFTFHGITGAAMCLVISACFHQRLNVLETKGAIAHARFVEALRHAR